MATITNQNVSDFNSPNFPTWCPGCGNFGIWAAIKSSLVRLNIKPHEVLMVYDVGCNGNMCNTINAYGFHGLHGRSIPIAEGVKIANHNIPIIVTGGDGGLFGEGISHFLNACRGNPNITVILHDNQVYALTTGQTAPTSDQGYVSKSTPLGAIEIKLNPIALAITQGATFVARGFSGRQDEVTDLIVKGIEHNGFSFVDILQPCVTFNLVHTYPWYRERVYSLDENIENTEKYDRTNLVKAYEKSLEWGDRIPLGIFYEEKDKPSYQDDLDQLKDGALVNKNISNIDIDSCFDDFM